MLQWGFQAVVVWQTYQPVMLLLDQFWTMANIHGHISSLSLSIEVSHLFRSTSSALSWVSQVSAGSVVQRCAGGGSCCDEEGRGGQGSEEPGPCTEVRGCSARTTGTWPPLSAASPPSSGLRSPSQGSHSPGNVQGQSVCEQERLLSVIKVVRLDDIKVIPFKTYQWKAKSLALDSVSTQVFYPPCFSALTTNQSLFHPCPFSKA